MIWLVFPSILRFIKDSLFGSKWTVFGGLAVVAVGMAVAIFSDSGAAPQGPKEVKIALLVPLSGTVPTLGVSVRDGALMAIDEWNARGGVLGAKIIPVVEDSQCTTDPAVKAANKVISQDKVKFIMGEVCSSASIVISDIANKAKVIQITPTSTNPLVTVGADGKVKDYIFRAAFIDAFQGQVGARFVFENLRARKAFIMLDPSNAYSKDLAGAFEASFIKLGGEIVAKEPYTSKDTNFSAILAKVAAVRPDVIYLPDFYNIVNLVTGQAREKGINTPFVGGDGWDSSDLDLKAADGGFFTNFYSPNATTAEVVEFVKAFGIKYKDSKGAARVPDTLAALAYDATNLLIQAMANAGTVEDTARVKDALAKISFQGVTGKITFDAQHNPIKSAVILQVKDGKVNYYSSLSVSAAAPNATSAVPREVTVAPATRAANPTTVVTAAAKPVTITVVYGWTDSYTGAASSAVSAAFKEYEKTHPGVTIVLNKQTDLTALSTYLRTVTAAGTPPDIVGAFSDQIGQMSAEGLIVALDNYQIDSAFMRSTFAPSAVAGVTFKNKIWGLPAYIEGIALVYNKKLVTGQYMPRDSSDWAGLLAAATQFQKDFPGKTLVCNPGFAGGDAYHIAPVFFGNGVPAYVDENGKVYVNTPEAVTAMQWLRSMLPVSQKEQTYDSCMNAFRDGKVGMWWTGPWALSTIEPSGVDYGVLRMGKPFVDGGTLMLAKGAVDRKTTDVALDIMKYFTGAEAQKKVAAANKTVPAALLALYTPEIQALPAILNFGTALQNGVPLGPTPYSVTQWGPVGDAVKTIWTNPASNIADVLKAAQSAIEAAISQMK